MTNSPHSPEGGPSPDFDPANPPIIPDTHDPYGDIADRGSWAKQPELTSEQQAAIEAIARPHLEEAKAKLRQLAEDDPDSTIPKSVN